MLMIFLLNTAQAENPKPQDKLESRPNQNIKSILGEKTYQIVTKGIEAPEKILGADAINGINYGNEILREKLTAKGLQRPGKENALETYRNKRLYIFISSSMPDEVIRRYMESSKAIPDRTVFVLRGFIGGISKFKPTIHYINRILCGDATPGSASCLKAVIDINPNLFREFKIEMVPAILFLPFGEIPCECGGCSENTEKSGYVSFGDASLVYHLAKIQEKSGLTEIDDLIRDLRNSYYDYEPQQEAVNGKDQ